MLTISYATVTKGWWNSCGL